MKMATMQQAIEKGHKRYFKNSYWKGLYNDAPSDAKKYYDLIFSQLDGGNDKENEEEFKTMMEETYRNMSEEGWKYLIENTTNQMGKYHLRKKKENLQITSNKMER
jgi:hypothetical protein